MFGLLDDDQPPPAIGLAGVLALVASAATAVLEASYIVDVSAPGSPWSWLIAPLLLGPALAGTLLLCAAAVCFRQTRWAMVSVAILLLGVAIPSVVVRIG